MTPYTVRKRHWCPVAERGLSETFFGRMDITRENVLSGKCELFQVNGDSWLVTEIIRPNLLFIWCYQGRGVVHLIERMRLVARENGLTTIGFFTHERAVLRALRRFNPVALRVTDDGETEWNIDCMNDIRSSQRVAV